MERTCLKSPHYDCMITDQKAKVFEMKFNIVKNRK